ncbi:MAG: lipopolysaccharide transport periplasmic protein LptA [Limimaricola sp.]|uniref:LptA/OstA family protein n=1 Tax=Limimaricola sp. TaxID=2211665 RepID=UPI001E0D1CB0|nr:LptA/OstA family protein [Limimaricola sp.]MBI1417103.1 lipopolysaccharide transport periplasmic protein LptA [Limimaricola sp.]
MLGIAAPAVAQTSTIKLGTLNADPTAPVQITADTLSVDQSSRTAVFDKNVRIDQGDLHISAGRVQATYAEETGQIAHLVASGGVTFATPTEAAEAANADYDLTTGRLVMTGSVLLTQGASAITADRMIVNVSDGNAQMDGNVKTVFNSKAN